MRTKKRGIKTRILLLALAVSFLLCGCVESATYNGLQEEVDALGESIVTLSTQNAEIKEKNKLLADELELKTDENNKLIKEKNAITAQRNDLLDDHRKYMDKGLGISYEELSLYFYEITLKRDDLNGVTFNTGLEYGVDDSGNTLLFYTQISDSDWYPIGYFKLTLTPDEVHVKEIAFVYKKEYGNKESDEYAEKFALIAAEGFIMANEDIKEYDESIAEKAKEFIASNKLEDANCLFLKSEVNNIVTYKIKKSILNN